MCLSAHLLRQSFSLFQFPARPISRASRDKSCDLVTGSAGGESERGGTRHSFLMRLFIGRYIKASYCDLSIELGPCLTEELATVNYPSVV
jgi:hypothetical protein